MHQKLSYRTPCLGCQGGKRAGGKQGPPEVVMNDMGSAGQQHLSLSKTVALRAHEIEPFAEALKGAVKSSRRCTQNDLIRV